MRNELARGEGFRAGEPASHARHASVSAGASVVLSSAIIVGAICWLVGDVLRVFAAGILVAIAFGSSTDWLMARGVERRGLALAIVMISVARRSAAS